ncbi:MAG: helix-turn-helix transcriptional regulator [Candidatus Aminicenantes bacterium]|nr:helix-turn-helix transcriptional regulator [Candidatus Aminicenantes bacterium]
MKKVTRIFKALSDPTRLRVVLLLLERELCVCELMAILKMEQSRVSHQLRLLRDAGLVEDAREGRWIIYRMPDGVKEYLRPLVERALGDDGSAAETIRRDRAAMELCLRSEVRKTRCPA